MSTVGIAKFFHSLIVSGSIKTIWKENFFVFGGKCVYFSANYFKMIFGTVLMRVIRRVTEPLVFMKSNIGKKAFSSVKIMA